jgi:ssDNA-binding Zn-finger/Zn-ribbon topoisomerase 1
MRRDKVKDEKLENAIEPRGVHCLKCGRPMGLEMKDLNELSGVERVMFLFRCDNECKKSRAFFDDGKEYIPEPDLCPKCKQPTLSTKERKDNVIITIHNCSNCQHSY